MSTDIKEQSPEYCLSPQETTKCGDGDITASRGINCSVEFDVNCEQFSWHEHVYRRLNNKPTPHYIENILGLGNGSPQLQNRRNAGKIEIIEPLNLSVKSEPVIRRKCAKEPTTRKRKKVREPLNTNAKVPEEKIDVPQLEDSHPKIDAAQPTVVEDVFENKKGKKKARTTFTGRQIFELEKQFELKKYLSSSERSEMAKLLNVTETQESPGKSSTSTSFSDFGIETNKETKKETQNENKSLVNQISITLINQNLRSYLGTTSIYITLKKIRIAHSLAELADSFGISEPTPTLMFKNSVMLMSQLMKELIIFPEKEEVQQDMPMPFRVRFANGTYIIDCLEIEIQKPTDVVQQALTWSKYKLYINLVFFSAMPGSYCIYSLGGSWISGKLFVVKIWFQNRRTKWKKIDNISNAEAAEHKTLTPKSDDARNSQTHQRSSGNSHSQSSNSSIESDSKGSAVSTVLTERVQPTFKDILHDHKAGTVPEIASSEDIYKNQIDEAKDVLLNLSFIGAETSQPSV